MLKYPPSSLDFFPSQHFKIFILILSIHITSSSLSSPSPHVSLTFSPLSLSHTPLPLSNSPGRESGGGWERPARVAAKATRGDGGRGRHARRPRGGRRRRRGTTVAEDGARGSRRESDEGGVGRAVADDGPPAVPRADPAAAAIPTQIRRRWRATGRRPSPAQIRRRRLSPTRICTDPAAVAGGARSPRWEEPDGGRGGKRPVAAAMGRGRQRVEHDGDSGGKRPAADDSCSIFVIFIFFFYFCFRVRAT